MQRTLFSLLALVSINSFAATNILYTASASPGANPDANANTVNVWTVSNGATAGSFQGNSAANGDGNGAGAGGAAWAVYSGAGSQADAVHTFAGGSLIVGQTVAMDFDNGFVQNTSGNGVVGVSLWNAASQNLFEFFFTGGQTTYQVNNSGGISNTSKPFTDDGFNFNFTLTGANTYTANLGGTALSGTLISNADQSIAKIRVFSFNNNLSVTGDTFFNNLAVTPEPGRALLLGFGMAAVTMRRRRSVI